MTDPALHIRPVTPADYPALATLHNAYYGIGWPMTAATLEAFDQVTEGGELPPRLAHRWVAEVDGDLAALALVRWTRIPDPHRYALNFVLADGWRDRPAAPTIRQA